MLTIKPAHRTTSAMHAPTAAETDVGRGRPLVFMAEVVATMARTAAISNKVAVSKVNSLIQSQERAQSSQAHACHPQECGALARSTGQSTSRAGNRQDGNKAGDEDEDATKSISDALTEHQQDVHVGRYR